MVPIAYIVTTEAMLLIVFNYGVMARRAQSQEAPEIDFEEDVGTILSGVAR